MRVALLSLCLVACGTNITTEPISPELAQKIQAAETKVNAQASPENMEALGDLYLEGHRLFEAAEWFLRADETGMAGNRIRGRMAWTYYQLGFLRSTLKSLQKCLQTNRVEAECLYVWGRLMEDDGSPPALKQAQAAYHQFLAVGQQSPRKNDVLSRLDQINAKLAAAGPSTQPASQPSSAPPKAPTEQPQAPTPVPGHSAGKDSADVGELNPFGQAIQRALTARQKGDAAAANQAYREALKLRPEDSIALAGLAQTLFAQEKFEEAYGFIEKAYQVDSQDAEVRFAYGLISARVGKNLAQSVKIWEALLKEHPDYAKQVRLPERLEGLRKQLSLSGNKNP